MRCNNCSKKRGYTNMQTTQINQNPYSEMIKAIAKKSNKACQTCGYKLAINDTFQQHSIINNIMVNGVIENRFDNFIHMLSVDFQLDESEKNYLIQQSTNFIRIHDALWCISKLMDQRPPNMRNIKPQQNVVQRPVQQQNQVVQQQIQKPVQQPNMVQQQIQKPVQQPQQHIVQQQIQRPVQQQNIVQPIQQNTFIINSSPKTLQEKTNELFRRISEQNKQKLENSKKS
jgi:hypothetical protein